MFSTEKEKKKEGEATGDGRKRVHGRIGEWEGKRGDGGRGGRRREEKEHLPRLILSYDYAPGRTLSFKYCEHA